jgi:glycosyltransferase involved in cell wall biosynthesis
MNTIKKIYIIDIFLTNYGGHYYAEATALREAAGSLAVKAQIVGSPKVDKLAAAKGKILPLAPDYAFYMPFCFRHFRKFTEFLNKNSLFAKTKATMLSLIRKGTSYWFEKPFDDFFRNIPKEPESIYLMQTSSFFVINRMLCALQKNKLDLKIVFSSHFMMSESEVKEIMTQLQQLNLTIAPKFFCSSEIHVKKYHAMGFQAAELLTIPQPGWSRYLNMPVQESDCLTLTFVGQSFYRKGFHLLPELVEKLRKHFPEKKFQFDIQYSTIRFNKRRRLIESTYRRLQKMDVNLITEKLDCDEYYNLLNRSDIVLQPYLLEERNPQYMLGGSSGILLEAMARGKIPVVPANSWLSLQVEKFNSGKIFSGKDDFFSKVIEAVNEFDDLKQIAETNKEYWSKLHCPENLIKTILSKYD